MSASNNKALRAIPFADRPDRLALLTRLLRELGHDVAAELDEADVAIVAIDTPSAQLLDSVVDRSAERSGPPIIACLAHADERLIATVAATGAFTCVVGRAPETWRTVMGAVLRQFADHHHLEGALHRRAVIERAKGVLMERHGTREDEAFELLRAEARSTNRRVVDIAQAILDGHRLLPETGRSRSTLPQS